MSVAALILAAQALKNRNTADTEAYKALIDQIATLADRPGRDGRDGRDGASIDRAVVRDGRLVLTRSTGDDIDVGPVTGPKGDRGEPGPRGESIVGPAGPAGRDGRDGEDGVGIADVDRVKDNIVLTLDDGRTVDLGSFRGPAGPSGPRGPTGTAGTGGTGGGTVSGPITSTDLTMATARVLGRTTAGTGAIEELQADDGSVILTGGNIRGRLVQRVFALGSGVQTTTSFGAPTWAIGVLVCSVDITPKSASNQILVRASVPIAFVSSSLGFIYAAVYKNGTGTNIPTRYGGANNSTVNGSVSFSVEHSELAGSTATQTWSLRSHSNIAGTAGVAIDAESAPAIIVEEWAP
jgi:hypothetical protein